MAEQIEMIFNILIVRPSFILCISPCRGDL